MYKIDIVTGQIIIEASHNNSLSNNWSEHNGTIYGTNRSDFLLAIDANTLALKWKWNTQNTECNCSIQSYNSKIDAEKNLLYLSNGIDLFCVKIPN